LQVIDAKSMEVIASWPLAPCEGPTGIAMDRASNRILAGCSKQSVVLNATTGKIVATIANGDGVDALGWDQGQRLMYIPAGRDGTVTVVHEDSPDKYTVVATIATMNWVKTVAVDPVKHKAYGFTPEYGPAPAPDADASVAGPGAPGPGSAGPAGRGPPRGPVIGAWLFTISH
jgi:hypothetical protein